MSVALEILVTVLLVVVFIVAVGSLVVVGIHLVARLVLRLGAGGDDADA